jgi:hypothetical protein
MKIPSVLSETVEDGINILKTLCDFLLRFGACEHDFTVDEDEQNNSRFHHSINQSWKKFWLIARELSMHLVEIF